MERDVNQEQLEEGLTSTSDSDEDWDDGVEAPLHLPAWSWPVNSYVEPDELRNTSAAEYRNKDKDPQAINWFSVLHKREDIRKSRRDAYENYQNLPDDVAAGWPAVIMEALTVDSEAHFFPFHSFRSSPKHTILHFQLRNLLWATSAFDFYYLSDNIIMLYNSLSHRSSEVLNLSGRPAAAVAPNVGRVPISTMCVSHGLVAAGGFYGELVVRELQGEQTFLCSKVMTTQESGITNGIEIFDCGSPSDVKLVAANNDDKVRVFPADRFDSCSAFSVPWAANWATASPHGGKLLAVVGDDPIGLVLDTATGDRVAQLKGHLDYSFAAAWHPGGVYLATANQDTTTRIWDMRKLDRSVHTFCGEMSAVRSLRYSPDGRFLAVAEAADFVNLYDVASGYTRAQEMEFFSEIAGITFTPDGTSFMISLQDLNHGGFLQYQRAIGEAYVPSRSRTHDDLDSQDQAAEAPMQME